MNLVGGLFVLVVLTAGACASEPIPATQGPLPLILRTQTRYFDACNDALLQPVRFTRVGEEVAFASVSTGQEVEIIWPKDFRARLIDGHAELLDSFAVTIAQEGDILDNVGGSGDPWNACSIGGRSYR